jgi:predicted DNA-binding protein YlxM (UPF0122 family)
MTRKQRIDNLMENYKGLTDLQHSYLRFYFYQRLAHNKISHSDITEEEEYQKVHNGASLIVDTFRAI